MYKVQMCLWNQGKMSRWRIDMRWHLARRRTNTKKNRMKDVHMGKSGAKTMNVAQPDKLRRDSTIRARSSEHINIIIFYFTCVSRVSCECVRGKKSVRIQSWRKVQVMLMTTYFFLRWMYWYEMDGRESRYIKEVLSSYRGEDAGDLKKSALNELVDSMICLDAFNGKSWISLKKCEMSKVTRTV